MSHLIPMNQNRHQEKINEFEASLINKLDDYSLLEVIEGIHFQLPMSDSPQIFSNKQSIGFPFHSRSVRPPVHPT